MTIVADGNIRMESDKRNTPIKGMFSCYVRWFFEFYQCWLPVPLIW
jgi:hypothetical protein